MIPVRWWSLAVAAVVLLGSVPAPAQADDGAMPEDHARHMHEMPGVLGPYPSSREASGTCWQPDSTPHHGQHRELGGWTVGAHLMMQGVLDHQGGDRGDDDVHASSMFMGMGERVLGDGRLGLRAMLSLDAATNGKDGYPLLLQTGETADGRTPLVDRQHPHDLFMELAAMYGLRHSEDGSVFAYFGFPGEPALGPPAFMHRFSAMENPEAPISHHWLDSTHIAFGVVTLGTTWRTWKIEGSVFTGREPDQNRYDFEEPKLDSGAGRLSWNPLPDWSLQLSGGHLESPEQLHPSTNTDRVTASIIYGRELGDGDSWQTLLAWGQNRNRSAGTSTEHESEHDLNALLLESAITLARRHTLFGRGERLEVDELFGESSPSHGKVFAVGKIALGYVFDVVQSDLVSFGLGGVGSVLVLPDSALRRAYGELPLSGMLFVRLRAG